MQELPETGGDLSTSVLLDLDNHTALTNAPWLDTKALMGDVDIFKCCCCNNVITCIPAPSGLVHWWRFDENTGTTAFDSRGNWNGSYVINPVPDNFGYVSRSLHFNGNNSVNAGLSRVLPTTNGFTIDAWIKLDANQPGEFKIIDQGFLNDNEWHFATSTSIYSPMHLGSSDGWIWANSYPQFPTNTWTFVAATVSFPAGASTNMNGKLYINGILAGTGHILSDPFLNTTKALVIGNDAHGNIDEVEIFNRPLDQTEIQALFNAGCSGKCKSIIINFGYPQICPYGPDSVTAQVIGGSWPYIYSWSTGDTTSTILVSTPGTYYVTVTDSNGEIVSDSVTVRPPGPLNATPVAQEYGGGFNISCNGAINGAIFSNVDGGCKPFSFIWSNGSTDENQFGIGAGTYSFTITDAEGATLSYSFILTEPTPVNIITNTTNPSCHDSSDGSITLLVNGGMPPYTFLWSNGDTTQNISGLPEGTYTVTVSDANGCYIITSQTITANPLLPVSVSIVASANPVFPGASVTFTATPMNGGTPAYQWYLNGVPVGEGLDNYTYVPADGDLVYVVMTSSLSECATGNPATSNTIIMAVSSQPANAVWTGNIDNNWNNAGNWNPGIPGLVTDVTIPAGRPNYPIILSIAQCHNIFFGSDASGTATLLDNGLLSINGIATVERYYSGNDLDWHFVSSPVENAVSGVFTNRYLQIFHESTNSYTDIIAIDTPLNIMEGYGLYSTMGASDVATFQGTLNTGIQSKGLTFSGPVYGWNLMGNPFVSSIDWETVTIPSSMSNEVHYIDAASGNDLSYVQGIGGTGSQFIPPMQGFFVRTSAPIPFILGDAQRTHMGANIFYKSDNPRLLILETAGTKYSDQTWIHLNDMAGIEHDGVYDAYKRISTSNPSLPQLFSLSPSGTKLSVNGMPEASEVPVGFTAVQSGVFTIRAVQTGEFTKVTLEDLFTGTFTDLLVHTYPFTFKAGDQENRFIIHLGENQADRINIYSSQKEVYISVPANKQGSVKIFNVLGQEVANARIVDSLTKLTIGQTGVYIVQVTIDGKLYTKKVIIQ